mmetsp:Transcript_1266/g.4527  ORF Transcript_1266/g.4527 Transcript_1266/m.4527 type:complete len:259 (-) Transcript_1266:225-1001(-)
MPQAKASWALIAIQMAQSTHYCPRQCTTSSYPSRQRTRTNRRPARLATLRVGRTTSWSSALSRVCTATASATLCVSCATMGRRRWWSSATAWDSCWTLGGPPTLLRCVIVVLTLGREKTSEPAMYDALQLALAKLGLQLVDYTCVPFVEDAAERRESSAPFYVVFIEVDEDVSVPASTVAAELDAALCLTNPVLATFRERNSIDTPSVHFMEKGSFERLRAELVSRGGVGQQTKIPRVLRRQADIVWMHEHALPDVRY